MSHNMVERMNCTICHEQKHDRKGKNLICSKCGKQTEMTEGDVLDW